MQSYKYKSFFHKLAQQKTGFTALAPMADVTDAAFREMFIRCGQPDIMWTEFVSADGLFLAPEQGRKFWLPEQLRTIAVEHGVASDNPLLKDLIHQRLIAKFEKEELGLGYDDNYNSESPIVAQFFSRDPDRMKQAAELAVALGFDGIDINMGCPAQVIVRQGAGCAMIREPDQAKKVIEATIVGSAGKIPVSVKTRAGFSKDLEREAWLCMLLETDIAALTLHARTRSDMSKVPARWENVSYLVEQRDRLNPEIIIIGNGDVSDLTEVSKRVQETGCDGVMIGRGIFGNPWRFNAETDKSNVSDRVILETLVTHSSLFDAYLGDTKSFALMRKHYKTYLKDTELSKSIKQEFMQAPDLEWVKSLADTYT